MSDLEGALGPFRLELDGLRKGTVDVDEPLTLHVGAEDGVVSLLEVTLGAAGLDLEFDPNRGGEAARLEREVEDRRPALAEVLRAYRSVTRLYPDILGTSYGGTPEDFAEFRRTVVPELLEAVEGWAREANKTAFADQVSTLRGEWEKAVH